MKNCSQIIFVKKLNIISCFPVGASGLVWFYGISTIVGYQCQILFFTYILNL